MNKITIIKSENPPRVCKEYTKDTSGKIIKSVVANVTKGIGVSRDANTAQELVKWLELVTSRNDLVLCAGLWDGDAGEKFEVLPEHELAKLLGSEVGKVAGGVIEHDGRLISARLKRGIKPSSWVLLDADNPVGIPEEWARMSISERLVLWDELLPNISKCERVELRGSSARVVNGSGSHKATHAWIRVSDPQKIALMKAYLSVEMVIKGVSFQYKKHSRIDPNKVVGIESRSVFDLAVFDTGRLVFTAKPTVLIEGYTVDDAGITIINEGAGPLDIDWITKPTESLHQYREMTGINMNVSISDDGYLSVHNSGQLTLETEIVSKGVIKSLAEWAKDLRVGEKLRCESPFRESASEAGFIKIGDDGLPFVHDVGNGTTYQLKKTDMVVSKELEDEPVDTSWMETTKNGKIIPEFQNLHAVIKTLPICFDKFLDSAMITEGTKQRRFIDGDYVKISMKLERMGFRSPSMSNVKDVARSVIVDNPTDMAIDWANGLRWDGVDRCSHLFSKYYGVEKSDYEKSCSLYFTSAMAGRLLQGGCQADMVVVLVGGQGLGKTRGVKALAPIIDTYSEIDLGNTRDSDINRQLRGKLICELGELKGLKSRDSEWIKSWITRTHEEWTPKYQEFSTIMARRCVFIGTTNESEFLVDRTGNRRWLPLDVVGDVDVLSIEDDQEQIWAQAITLFKNGGIRWKEAQELGAKVHHNYMVTDDGLMTRLTDYLAKYEVSLKPYLRISDIGEDLDFGFNISKRDQMRLADCLVQLGWYRENLWVEGKRFKAWVKK
jgi:hypothetical protein